jgi:crotonobetainyl-CoA:carnitine CoA-transferase CaiB-like acyl-CoA transferase
MSGALAGIRVLDLTRLLPGGFCSLLLADFGADVLKVEDTAAGDYVRWMPPFVAGAEPGVASAAFLALNRGKRSLRLDLKRPEGREVLLRLARGHDVLLESFRPGVLDRLGVGPERLRAENPRLCTAPSAASGRRGRTATGPATTSATSPATACSRSRESGAGRPSRPRARSPTSGAAG